MTRNANSSDEPMFVISVAARMVNLHPQTLRHYEKVGLLEPARTNGKVRLYSQRDIERLRKITELIEDLGVNLAGVEVILNMARQIEELQAQIATMEQEFQGEIQRVQGVLHDQRRRQPLLPEPNMSNEGAE